ncbi:MAG: VWA domain-containing protein [Chloroflexi bacterium]|nr:VWA domain-containing protein [Chloroflexota bacterium]
MACYSWPVVTFTQPFYLALLVLLPISALIALPRLRRQRGKGGARLAPTHAWAGLLIRSLLLLCIVFSLAGMQSVTYNSKLAVAFLVDVSDSIRASGRDAALQFVRQALGAMRLDGSDKAAVVVFGADAQVERSLSSAKDLTPIGTQVRVAGTNVESAIRLGLSLLPTDYAKRLVLLSDGKQTVGDADSAARLVRAVNARLDVVTLQVAAGSDAAIERIDAPQRASVGQIIPLQIVVRSNAAMRAQLTVFAGPDLVTQESVNLVVGLNEFSVRANATRSGFSAFRVQIAPEQDTVPQNDTLSASVIIGGPPRVLLVAMPPAPSPNDQTVVVDETSALKTALGAAGILFDETTPRAMPSEIQSLATYQAVILVNVPARELSLRAMYSLQSYVRDTGGGLVAVGGPSSYGVGGYFKTPLEETLPVETQIKDPRRFPSVSMVIVMDKSGSMSVQENGVLKMRLAAEAAARAAEMINDDDEITVIGFDTEMVDLIGPFTGRERVQYIPRILSIAPGGGGIYVFESLTEARRIVAKSNRLTKFIILLADGNDSERQDGVRDMVKQMRAEDVTLSVVAIGDGTDVNFLKDIARIGGGRFHMTDKAANLPTIFTEETALAQRSYIVEQNFFPKQGAGSPILNGITAMPQLLGYVATSAKPAAQVVLKVNETDPLLATWQYGLGRVVAFTSDATGRWAKSWVAWQEFPKFWAQAVRWTILDRADTGVEAKITQQADQTMIEADLPPARTEENAKLTATLIDSEGKSQQIPLVQTAPGHYETPAYLDQPGAYFVRIESSTPVTGSQAGAQAGTQPVTETLKIERTLAWVKPYSAEYAPSTGGGDAMDAWAALGGGTQLANPAQAFELNVPVAASRTDLFPWLMALAALLLPFDIGVRRIAVSFRKLLGLGRRELAMASLERGGRMSQLMQAKTRGTQTQEPVSLFDRSPRRGQPAPPWVQPGNPAVTEDSAQEQEPESPSQAGATASELLRRRRRAADAEQEKENREG